MNRAVCIYSTFLKYLNWLFGISRGSFIKFLFSAEKVPDIDEIQSTYGVFIAECMLTTQSPKDLKMLNISTPGL
jgi:hypothetical protein